jgi:hypothetical protein
LENRKAEDDRMTGEHGIKMESAIRAAEGEAAAAEFARALPLSRSADTENKFEWAQAMCRYLEGAYPAERVANLRMAACCQPNGRYLEKARAMYVSASSLEEFCEAYNREYTGKHSVRADEGAILFSYPECYCAMVKRVNAPLSKTWCLCTLGYAKKLFDYILGCETKVELLESVKMGDERCTMRITRA